MWGVLDLGTIDAFITGGTTVMIVVATVLLALAVVVPGTRRFAALPAALLALLGAISARFTQVSTSFGDAIFRGSTVFWALGLAFTAVLWWLLSSPSPQDATGSENRSVVSHPHTARAASTTLTAVATAPAPPITASPRRRVSPARIAVGCATLLVAAGTFLTATGLFPVGLSIFAAIGG